MGAVVRLAPVAVGIAVLVGSVGSAGAEQTASTSPTTSRAFAVQAIIPGQGSSSAASVSAPPDSVGVGGSFDFPADGSVIHADSVTSGAFATPGTSATASSSAEVSTISIFGGDVTVTAVAARAKAGANARKASADSAGSDVTGLVILGQPVTAGPGTRFTLGDWGYAVTLQQGTNSLDDSVSKGARAFVTGLDVRLTADHNGLPAGTEVMVGYAEAAAKAEPVAKSVQPHKRAVPAKKPKKKRHAKKAVHGPGIGPEVPGIVTRPPPDVTPKLTAGGYVFPVYGPSSFGDTFGAPRGDIASGWHHGEDIFAQLGAPILAVADGTVFSVGWNNVGGYRFWLRDHQGNEFYFAHLSAYSPYAVNGREVKAGTVIAAHQARLSSQIRNRDRAIARRPIAARPPA